MQEYFESASDELISTKHIKLPKDEQSDIQKFYAGSSIFITGASGFLGKLLVEKLLRTCSDLTHIYILMREKKGKTIEERFNDVFQNVVFDRLRFEQPLFNKKISVIYGDLEQSDMSLSNTDLELIRSKIDVVFHVAATVRFDEHLRKATNINVRSTKCLLDIAKTMSKLTAFVYVSTAYSNCIQSEIKETFYDVPITFDKLIHICDSFDDSQLEKMTPEIIGKWPNTYSFTKAITENLIKTYGQDLPLTIVRPSIVMSTATEPVSGWQDTLIGVGGLSAGIAVGVIHTLFAKYHVVSDFIPADYTINTIITAAWKRGLLKNNLLNKTATVDVANIKDIVLAENIPIYNNVSSSENPVQFGPILFYAIDYGKDFQTINCVWHYFLFIFENRLAYLIACFFMHLLPALLIDAICICIGKKPFLVKLYKKIFNMNEHFKYFLCNQWKFCNKNTQALWKTMSAHDQLLFNFNIADIDWNVFIKSHARGIRIYLFNDPMTSLKQGQTRYFRFKIAHYCLMAILLYTLLRFTAVILRFLL